MAIKWGIIIALEAGLSGFSVASDCASIVNALNKKIIVFCDCGVILGEILNFFCYNSFEGLAFTPRCVNRVAYNLARFVAISSVSQVWKGEIPFCASSAVLADKPIF